MIFENIFYFFIFRAAGSTLSALLHLDTKPKTPASVFIIRSGALVSRGKGFVLSGPRGAEEEAFTDTARGVRHSVAMVAQGGQYAPGGPFRGVLSPDVGTVAKGAGRSIPCI